MIQLRAYHHPPNSVRPAPPAITAAAPRRRPPVYANSPHTPKTRAAYPRA